MRTSHSSAAAKPPASAGPLTAATTGSARRARRSNSRVLVPTMRTPRADGSTSSRPIWVVVVDGAAYVRSYQGERGAWYRRARAEGRAEVGVEGEDVAVRVVPATGGDLDERVSQAYHDKYGRRS